MGAAIGSQLVKRGHDVRWLPAGRGQATARRAREAGLTAAENLSDVEVILSVCPPHAALDVAQTLRGTPALVIDANAISPATARQVGEVIGERWADGSIVGPPPERAGTTRLYLSGPGAGEASRLFDGTALEAVTLTGSPVAASAVKMAYAAWTKGSAALLLGALASARANGVEDALRAEWRRSQPELEDRVRRAGESAASKGWRWVAEMEEIAATFADAGLPSGFHEAAAEMFERAARAEGIDSPPHMPRRPGEP